MHHVRLTEAAPHPNDHRSARPTRNSSLFCRRPGAPHPIGCLTYELRSDTTTEGERNRFYPIATFADRQTRESVIAHKRLSSAVRITHRRLLGADF